MEIDIQTIVLGVVSTAFPEEEDPMAKLVELIGGPSMKSLTNIAENTSKTIDDIEKQEEEAKYEPNEEIKEKLRQRLEDQKQTLEEIKQKMQEQFQKMQEEFEQKIQEWLDNANTYAQEIAIAAEAIPAALQSYLEAGIEIGVQTTLLITAATKAAAALAIGVDLTDSVAAQSANLKAAVEEYNSAKEQLKASIASFNTAVMNLLDSLNPFFNISYVVPGINKTLGELIKEAVSVPIETAKSLIQPAIAVVM